MTTMSRQSLTELLQEWQHGDKEALDKLTPLVYDELRRIAHRYVRRERDGHTLETTALVNEAYLRLVDSQNVRWQNRAHFFAVSAQLMRRILVDHARQHKAEKRFGGLTFEEAADVMGVSLITVKRHWKLARAWLYGHMSQS